ncbi:unnamed protein product [Schistocephalus solidus]|uniref:PIPK domain-containing protein n=1 Tax=Schistocephalus solidus TaxID=70667 RepID=A0A183T670_SCHSO|nr:unnamed protein product [Schistocephalus solidus]
MDSSKSSKAQTNTAMIPVNEQPSSSLIRAACSTGASEGESFTRSQPLWDSVRGKSGSKFLITYNRHYVVKSISSEEVEQMHHFLENYHEYVVNCHGQTLLPQYLGMYRVTVNDQESYLLAMRNVFSPRVTIHKKYDLKVSRCFLLCMPFWPIVLNGIIT